MTEIGWSLAGTNLLKEIMDRLRFPTGLQISISDGKQQIISCKGIQDEYNIEIDKTIGEEYRQKISSALIMSGLLDLIVSFTNGKDPKPYDSKNVHHQDFQAWWMNLVNDRTLVPDTNIIMDRTFSSIELIVKTKIFNKIRINIPRLTVLELEQLANNKNKSEYSLKKRIALLGYAELIHLRSNNAQFLPEISTEILSEFSKIAGNFSTDSWIRREIKNESSRLVSKTLSLPNFTFVTSDLVSSLSAIAEGIDTIYIAKQPYKMSTLTDLERLAKFLVILSIILEEITVKINSDKYKIKGNWTGKTSYEHMSDLISYKTEK